MDDSPFLALLKNRINLHHIPFSERGSRLLVFRKDDYLQVRLAERWFKRDRQLSSYRQRPPLVDEWRFTDGTTTTRVLRSSGSFNRAGSRLGRSWAKVRCISSCTRRSTPQVRSQPWPIEGRTTRQGCRCSTPCHLSSS